MGSTVRLDSQSPYLRVHAVNIYVRDQERSLRFYREQLGFEVALDARARTGERLVAVAPPDGTAVLLLVAPEPDTEQRRLIGRPTQVVFLTEDVLAKFREWTSRGVKFRRTPRLRRVRYEMGREAEKPVWGEVYARFEDPDGNSFALVGFDEFTREIEAQRRAAAEKLEGERRAAQELEIARQVQARLFPQRLPPCRTLDYAGICIQARRVGGDYYDFLNLGQERLGLVVGDIAGKGIAAALLMANLQANLRSQCATALEAPERFLRSVNQLFYENTGESAYATLFFAEYDDRRRRLRYANCGHVPGLLLRDGGELERLGSTATVLGLFRDWECEIAECGMAPRDTLVLYTDGVTESTDDRGEEFGEERLAQALERHREAAPRNLLAAALERLKSFSPHEQHDDVTMIVARCR